MTEEITPSPDFFEISQTAKKLGYLYPQLLDHSIDKEQIIHLIKNQKEDVQEALNSALQHITYVDFSTFLDNFKNCLKNLVKWLQEKKSPKIYAIQTSSWSCKSNQWITAIAFDIMKTLGYPIAGLISNPNDAIKQGNNYFVLFDDGIFSGHQMKDNIRYMVRPVEMQASDYILKTTDVKLGQAEYFKAMKSYFQNNESAQCHIAVIAPYITDDGRKLINQFFKDNDAIAKDSIIFYAEKIVKLSELLEEKTLQILRQSTIDFKNENIETQEWTNLTNLPLFYFQHKQPDFISTNMNLIQKHYSIIKNCKAGDKKCPLPPYKKFCETYWSRF